MQPDHTLQSTEHFHYCFVSSAEHSKAHLLYLAAGAEGMLAAGADYKADQNTDHRAAPSDSYLTVLTTTTITKELQLPFVTSFCNIERNENSEHFNSQSNPYGSVECLENFITKNYLTEMLLRVEV